MSLSTFCSRAALAWTAALALDSAACTRAEAPGAAPAVPAAAPAEAGAGEHLGEGPHWGYEGAVGPSSWDELSPVFAPCASGRSQSPIDIDQTSSAALPELRAAFPPAELRIAQTEHLATALNNGHTIQVTYTQGDTLAVGDTSYELAQYHFHAPSEHTVRGKHSPMEMHLVHQSSSGGLAVVAVLIEEGAQNAAFDPVWSNLPTAKGVESRVEQVRVNVDDLLPKERSTYRYDGSLTTPPCSEGVKWLVMTTPIHLSAAQITAFTAIIERNNRPVQPLYGRVVATDLVLDADSR